MPVTPRKAKVTLLIGLPIAVLVGVTTLGGAAWGQASPHSAPQGTGTVSCSRVTGQITFKPPLSSTGTLPESASLKIKMSSCSVNGTASKVTSAFKGTFGTANNSCSFFTNTSNETLNMSGKWKKEGSSESTFGAGSISVAPNGQDLDFNLANGETVGAYSGEQTSATFVGSNTAGEACISGHPHAPGEMKIVGGSYASSATTSAS